MTTEAGKRSVFSRAEGGARQVVLQIGLGVAAWVLGGFFQSGASARIAERFGYIESATVAFAVGWLLQRSWVLVLTPLFGWCVGRFTAITPLSFATAACLSGEVFSVLFYTAMNGFDTLLDDPPQMITRLVTLLIGMAITVSAVSEGRRASREAAAVAAVVAEKNKAEYAEFLKQQEAIGSPPAAPTDSGPGSH